MDIERKQPHYLSAQDIETLARQNVQLMAELWIAKDRIAVLEDMLEKKGIIDRSDFEKKQPDDALTAELEADRVAYIKRIIGVTTQERSVERLKDMAPKK
ncbi:MAG: hypothetical protein AAF607_11715 [Pseudomonadota bacterium]